MYIIVEAYRVTALDDGFSPTKYGLFTQRELAEANAKLFSPESKASISPENVLSDDEGNYYEMPKKINVVSNEKQMILEKLNLSKRELNILGIKSD